MTREKEMDRELEQFKKRVQAYRGTLLGLAFGRGDAIEPAYNGNTNSSINTDGVKYVIYLCPFKKVFIVWDYKRRRELGLESKGFYTAKKWDEVLDPRFPITRPYYKSLPIKGTEEKVYVVSLEDTKEFVQHIDEYMQFNPIDVDVLGKAFLTRSKNVDMRLEDERVRKRYSSIKLQRLSDFRRKVLDAYGNQCAICRCEIRSALQAAHLHGHEVADTDLGEDIPQNGICLCANHHLMYDADIIDIDVKKGALYLNNDEAVIIRSDWYIRFQNEYRGSLIMPVFQE